MDELSFDALTRVLGTATSRRALLALVGNLLAASQLGALRAGAKKKKKKKTTLCLNGQTIQASKKKKKKLLKSGATPGPCPPGCTPACEGKPCGADDGCGGTCGCAAGSVCQGGVCQTCTVTCTGDGTACGNVLKTFLNGGGTVVACPGRYVGNFELTAANVTLIGAGDGEDPGANTILDAKLSGRVVQVNATVNAALHGLRITGGNPPENLGGGIRNLGTLTLTACTVDTNTGVDAGGIFNASGLLTLNDCVVSRNTAASGAGGGIVNSSGATIHGSTITGNHAAAKGGGLLNQGTVTFDIASSITDNTCTGADCGGGIFNNGGTVTLNGATVSGNTEPQCVNC